MVVNKVTLVELLTIVGLLVLLVSGILAMWNNAQIEYQKEEITQVRNNSKSTRVDMMQIYWEVKTFPDGHQYGLLLDDYSEFSTTKIMHFLHHADCAKCAKKLEPKKEVIPEEFKPIKIKGFNGPDKCEWD